MKYGRVKREHGRVRGLDDTCDAILKHGPGVTRIVPGRIKRRRGTGPAKLTVQYETESGIKCMWSISGTVQEVFVVTGTPHETRAWLDTWIDEQGLKGQKA
ncbi:MAG: DUF2103 domain-containing protein [Planctomycetota bacterium]